MEKIKVLHYKYESETRSLSINLIEIDNTLESMQELVGGHIEIYPITNKILIVCNEEGKLLGLPLLAMVKSDNLIMEELIAGDFFICRRDGEDLVGLRERDLVTIKYRVFPLYKDETY